MPRRPTRDNPPLFDARFYENRHGSNSWDTLCVRTMKGKVGVEWFYSSSEGKCWVTWVVHGTGKCECHRPDEGDPGGLWLKLRNFCTLRGEPSMTGGSSAEIEFECVHSEWDCELFPPSESGDGCDNEWNIFWIGEDIEISGDDFDLLEGKIKECRKIKDLEKQEMCMMDAVDPVLEYAFNLFKEALPGENDGPMNCTGDMTQ